MAHGRVLPPPRRGAAAVVGRRRPLCLVRAAAGLAVPTLVLGAICAAAAASLDLGAFAAWSAQGARHGGLRHGWQRSWPRGARVRRRAESGAGTAEPAGDSAGDEAAAGAADEDAAAALEKPKGGEKTLFFGGVTTEAEETKQEKEESAKKYSARNINQMLAKKRLPQPRQEQVRDTQFYDELGIAPTATQEELKLKFLDHAERVEKKLSYLQKVEQQQLEEDVVASLEVSAKVPQLADAESSELGFRRDDEDTDLDDYAADEPDDWEDESESEAVELQATADLRPIVKREKEEILRESEKVTMAFQRISNLYQILSSPSLRKLYDEGGLKGLMERVPKLKQGLMHPDQFIKFLSGKAVEKARPALLLRRPPDGRPFGRYQAQNSIRNVIDRMTDVIKVRKFTAPEQLKELHGTVYEHLPEIAIFGRVNSGKSSILQHMLRRAPMRQKRFAMTAQRAGKTKGVNVYCVNRRFTFADMAGYSRGDVDTLESRDLFDKWHSQERPLMETYLNSTKQLRAALYVHDIAKDVTRQDLHMIKMLRKNNIPTLLVLTKDDKVDSDTHRVSRVKRIRDGLGWPAHWPHAHYSTRFEQYARTFRNQLGTMLLAFLATESRTDAWGVLTQEIPQIFHDYRDRWVKRKVGDRNAKLRYRRWREDDRENTYTEMDLKNEELEVENQEKLRRRQEVADSGRRWGPQDDIEEEAGKYLTPQQRRMRWMEILTKDNVHAVRAKELEDAARRGGRFD